MVYHEILKLRTKKQLEITDITDAIQRMVEQTGVQHGIVNIQSLHTTASILMNENETLLHEDFRKHLEHIAPQDHEYYHDDGSARTENICDGECANGHAHCKAMHLPASVTLNVQDNRLVLGMWQRVLFLELDRPRPRSIHVTVFGE